MAISSTHYQLLSRLKPLLPQGGTLLEIGEANWYGDLDPESVGLPRSENLFNVAKAFYSQLFAPRRVVSVDMNGTAAAWRCDLNQPLPPLGSFDVVINHGTAEHVFNIAQVFASMHAACAVGGLMVHESPFTGWIDHGFYCLQPTLFYDVAAANGYEIVSVHIEEIKSGLTLKIASREHLTALAGEHGSTIDNSITEIPNNSMLYIVFRKLTAGAFRIPTQGYYAKTLSEAGERAWEEMR